MGGAVPRLDVLIDRRRRVDVVDDEVEPAVVIEVGIRRAVREAWLPQAPGLGLIPEGEVAVVAEDVVRDTIAPQRPHLLERRPVIVRPPRREHRRLIVEIVRRLGIAVGGEQVLVAVVVEVGQQRAPAPIGRCNAGEHRDVAEHHVAGWRDSVAQLQRVGVVVIEKATAPQLDAAAVGEIAAHALALLQARRQHVHLRDVGPAVVVEVGDIDAHAGEARMLERRRPFVGERAVAVVDVQRVIGRHVVRDVDVGPPVAIHIGHYHAEPVSDLPQDARLL